MILKKGSIIGLIVIFFTSLTFMGCDQNSDVVQKKYSTTEEAILGYMEENDVNDVYELDDAILANFGDSNNLYLLKRISDESENLISVYILEVTSVDETDYICEKKTADFALQNDEDVSGEEHSPYSQIIINVDDFYIHTGVILDSNYKVYFEGKELSLNEDNIYIHITKYEDFDVEIKEMK